MSKQQDPAGAPENKFVVNHDRLKANLNNPDLAPLVISPDDQAKTLANNTDLHAAKDASDQADGVAQEKTRDKNTTFERVRKDYRETSQRIKKTPGYTKAKGELLGIERTEAPVDGQFSDTGPQPVLKVKARPTGGAELKSTKNGADAADVYSERDGDSQAIFLMRVLRFPWVDNRPLLVPGKPETRTYFTQLIKGNQPIGQPSAIVKVVVTG